jgi:hypothetical protein
LLPYCLITHILLDCNCTIRIKGVDFVRDIERALYFDIAQDNLRTFIGQQRRNCRPESPRRTRNQGNLVINPSHETYYKEKRIFD